MKKVIINYFILIAFITIITAPTILYLCFGEVSSDKILNEKRKLADFPTEITNDYALQVEKWYKDHTPYRKELITIYKKTYQQYSKRYRQTLHPKLSEFFKKN